MIQRYAILDISIERSNARYYVRVLRSPVGQASEMLNRIPFTETELSQFSESLESGDLTEHILEDIGGRLFEAIFIGNVNNCLQRSLERISADEGLRIQFRFDTAPELALLPWECLYDSTRNRFLGHTEQTSIVRYISTNLPELESVDISPPLRILAVVSNPRDLHLNLDAEREWQIIQDAFGSLQNQVIVLERLHRPTFSALQSRLREAPIHVIHFIGHGYANPETGHSGLVFEDEAGRQSLVSSRQLAALLHNHPQLRLVFLNACRGGVSSGEDVAWGSAQSLVRQGIPAVVAMQASIEENAAEHFAREFYTALGHRYPIDAAITQARISLYALNRPDWVIPVFFTRSSICHLFQTPSQLPWAKPYTILTKNRVPYIGTIPYQEKQAALFFGRDKEIRILLDKIEAYSPWLLINGVSGAGKTSLIRAGLVPALRKKGYQVLYSSVLDTPEQDVLDAFRRQYSTGTTLPDNLVDAINFLVCSTSQQQSFILIIDQLERAFTLAKDHPQRQQFWKSIARLLSGVTPCLRKIVFVMRADWLYAIQEEISNLHVGIFDYTYLIDPLSPESAEECLAKPLERFQIPYEKDVIHDIVEDLRENESVNPSHLQIVGETLYRYIQEGNADAITRKLYTQLGRADSIIRNRFERVVNLLGPQATLCRRILMRFIDDTNGVYEGLRVSKREQELRGEISTAQFQQIIEHLTNHSIVIREISSADQQPVYTLTHDSLLEELRRYAEHSEDIQRWRTAQRYLTMGYADWKASECQILLDADRYRYIWENRAVLGKLEPGYYEFLMYAALSMGEKSFANWLTLRFSPEESLDITHEPEECARILQRIVDEYMLAVNPSRMQNACCAVIAAVQEHLLPQEIEAHLAALLWHKYVSSKITPLYLHSLVPVLWVIRNHLSPQQRNRLIQPRVHVLISENRNQIKGAIVGSTIVALIVSVFLLISYGLSGVWHQADPLYAGMVTSAVLASGPSKDADIYAMTQIGASVEEGATLLRYEMHAGQWSVLSRNLTKSPLRSLLVTRTSTGTHIYVGKEGTGLVRSDDNGKTWKEINFGLRSFVVQRLSADMVNPNIIYAGSGDRKGFFVSLDQGEHWQDASGDELFGATITAMIPIIFDRKSKLLIGTEDGRIVRYEVNNSVLEPVFVYPGAGLITAFAAEPTLTKTIYAGTNNGHLFRSHDGGSTWRPIEQIPGTFIINSIAVTPDNPDVVYVDAFGIGGNILWRSVDGGESWQPVEGNHFTRQHLGALLMHPEYPGSLFAAGEPGFFETRDQGKTWLRHDIGAPLAQANRVEISSVEGGPIYIAVGGSVYRKQVLGGDEPWHRGENLPAVRIRDIVADPDDPNQAFAATYVPNEWSIFKTVDGGMTWQETGHLESLSEAFYNDTMSLHIDTSSSDKILYAGIFGCGVIYSTDAGATWNPLTSGCESEPNEPKQVIDITTSPSGTIYVAADGNRVYVSQDRGRTWVQYEPPIQGRIHTLISDPKIEGRIYLIARSEGFWRSDDGGATWSEYSRGLQDKDILAMDVSPEKAGVVFIASESGEVWWTTNGGERWQPLHADLPLSRIAFLEFDKQSGDLLIGSSSAGLFIFRPRSLLKLQF